ncbi:hypothetical protein [Streptomyces sp. NPDC002088]|uniref:hypothetical protein n=1 Tax=Streptomyces sp. NPDC002088 TaxID=3154665 RepID=UPI00332677CB
MNDQPVHRDDITALKADGDLKAYMRSLIQPTKNPAVSSKRKRKPSWGAIPIPPDHRPGAWPTGTSPPAPSPERNLPAADWDQAIDDYRTTRQDDDTDEETTP